MELTDWTPLPDELAPPEQSRRDPSGRSAPQGGPRGNGSARKPLIRYPVLVGSHCAPVPLLRDHVERRLSDGAGDQWGGGAHYAGPEGAGHRRAYLSDRRRSSGSVSRAHQTPQRPAARRKERLSGPGIVDKCQVIHDTSMCQLMPYTGRWSRSEVSDSGGSGNRSPKS
jgi:hypothetical protein